MNNEKVTRICREVQRRLEEEHIGCFEGMDQPLFLISNQYPGVWLEHVYDSVFHAMQDPSKLYLAENTLMRVTFSLFMMRLLLFFSQQFNGSKIFLLPHQRPIVDLRGLHTGKVAVVAEIRQLYSPRHGMGGNAPNVVHVRYGGIVGEEPQGLQHLLGKAHARKRLERVVGILHNVVQEGAGNSDFVLHLLCQMEGMEHVGHPRFIHLISMGIKGEA